MLSKLWATCEMNFWERKIHRALECNLTFLTRRSRGSAVHQLHYCSHKASKHYDKKIPIIIPFKEWGSKAWFAS